MPDVEPIPVEVLEYIRDEEFSDEPYTGPPGTGRTYYGDDLATYALACVGVLKKILKALDRLEEDSASYACEEEFATRVTALEGEIRAVLGVPKAARGRELVGVVWLRERLLEAAAGRPDGGPDRAAIDELLLRYEAAQL